MSAMNPWFYLQVSSTKGSNPLYLTPSGATAGSGVTVEAAQPGQPSQLWQLNSAGNLVPAINPGLALTCAGHNQAITLQAAQSGDTAQQWQMPYPPPGPGNASSMQDDYQVYSVGQHFVLYIDGSIEAGTSVVGGDPKAVESQQWNAIPYRLPSAQYFYIQVQPSKPPAAPPPGALVISVDGGAMNAGTGIVLAAQQKNATTGLYERTLSELWCFTLDGYIVSALNPNLVLTAPSTDVQVTIAPIEAGNANQIWFLAENGAITNVGLGGGYALNVYWGDPTVGAKIITYPPPYYSQSLWYIVPWIPGVGQWTAIRSDLSSPGNDLVLNIQGSSLEPGTATIVWPMAAGANNSIWKFDIEGHIVSGLNAQTALSVGPNNTVVVYPLQPGNPSFQLWSAGPGGTIISRLNGLALTVSNGAAVSDTAVVVDTLASPPTAGQTWQFSPGTALQTLLFQPAVPFPKGQNTSQDTAYKAIDTELGLSGSGGLRAQYCNLAAPLAGYQAAINVMGTPADVDATDWSAVLKQLNKELIAAQAVQSLFQQFTALYLELNQAQIVTLSELVAAAALSFSDDSKKSHAWIWDIIEGVVYTALSDIASIELGPEAGKAVKAGLKFGVPAVANLLQTTFTSGQAGWESRSSSKKLAAAWAKYDKFEGSLLELQQALLAAFESSGLMLGAIETSILADWGKLQQVYAMIAAPKGDATLFWPAVASPSIVPKLLPGYALGALQALVPATSAVVKRWSHQGHNVSSPGLQSATLYVEFNADGTQTAYSTTASEQVMQLVWDNYGVPFNFFKGVDGWKLPFTEENLGTGSDIIVTFQNLSSQAFTIKTAGGILGNSNNLSLPAYGLVAFAGTKSGITPFATTFTVVDSSGTQIFSGNCSNADVTHDWTANITPSVSGYTCESVIGDPGPTRWDIWLRSTGGS